MSLLRHLRLYHDDWMSKRDELNQLFASRPPLPFTIYPEEEIVVGRPFIGFSMVHTTVTRVPGTNELMLLTDYCRERLGYTIHSLDEYAIFFDADPTIFYPAELIYLHDIDNIFLQNPFTIVV